MTRIFHKPGNAQYHATFCRRYPLSKQKGASTMQSKRIRASVYTQQSTLPFYLTDWLRINPGALRELGEAAARRTPRGFRWEK